MAGRSGRLRRSASSREYEAEEIQLSWLIEDQYHSECWDLYGGVRLDYYHLEDNRDDTTDDQVLVGGAVGACRHLNKRLTAYGNASLGWRRASLYERTATAVVDGAVVFGNPELDPELNGNLELGLKGALKNRVSLQAAAFAHYATTSSPPSHSRPRSAPSRS